MSTSSTKDLHAELIAIIVDSAIKSIAPIEGTYSREQQDFLLKCRLISRRWAAVARDRLFERPIIGGRGLRDFVLEATQPSQGLSRKGLTYLALRIRVIHLNVPANQVYLEDMQTLFSRMGEKLEELAVPDRDINTMCPQGIGSYLNLRILDLRATSIAILPLLQTSQELKKLRHVMFGRRIIWRADIGETDDLGTLERLNQEALAIKTAPPIDTLTWHLRDGEENHFFLRLILDMWGSTIKELYFSPSSDNHYCAPVFSNQFAKDLSTLSFFKKCPHLRVLSLNGGNMTTLLREARHMPSGTFEGCAPSLNCLCVRSHIGQLDTVTRQLDRWVRLAFIKNLQELCVYWGPPNSPQQSNLRRLNPFGNEMLSPRLRRKLSRVVRRLKENHALAPSRKLPQIREPGILVSDNIFVRSSIATAISEHRQDFIPGFQGLLQMPSLQYLKQCYWITSLARATNTPIHFPYLRPNGLCFPCDLLLLDIYIHGAQQAASPRNTFPTELAAVDAFGLLRHSLNLRSTPAGEREVLACSALTTARLWAQQHMPHYCGLFYTYPPHLLGGDQLVRMAIYFLFDFLSIGNG